MKLLMLMECNFGKFKVMSLNIYYWNPINWNENKIWLIIREKIFIYEN